MKSSGRVVRAAAALILGGGTVALLPVPASAATADFKVQGEWTTGYTAAMTVRNNEPNTITSWRVEFDLPAGTTIPYHWSVQGGVIGNNHYVFTNQAWNGTLAPGASTTFGWQANGTGKPYNCLVNGQPCGGTGPEQMDVNPPSTPTNIQVDGAEDAPGMLIVSWDAATDDRGVVAYEIHGNGGRMATTTETSYRMPVPPPALMAFGIRAVDAAGNLSPSGIVDFTGGQDSQPPTAPANLRINGPQGGYLKVGWDASQDRFLVAGYELYLNSQLISKVGGTSGYVPYHGYGTYWVAVRAFDGFGHFSPLTQIGLAIDPPPPSPSPTR
ncbi:cellulose binding domain-containing protein [Micromonospora zhanjiangensis]